MLTLCIVDLFGTKGEDVTNPIVGGWFRVEEGPAVAAPPYPCDEVGLVFEGRNDVPLGSNHANKIGELTLEDETGQTKTITPGETFIIHRGSTIKFSSSTYGLAWKCRTQAPKK